ncbi:hypothetical protein [Haliovirga abyssi]|uniref:Uncharacterized protein n=1 Tax=Haliovirga abyssi TaxID=2996794 RepID=A0AAU9DE57_9FUSO|nr:hypothetical protein [Haliovirga abyssi]BDU50612.1 hypothetical protein HLVA_11810 [Haliovirga abyssi]
MVNETTNNKITDKELLVFSNLANLDWQFVNLKDSTVKIKNNGKNKLKDLLTPKSFIRKNEKGEFEKYIYMPGVKDENSITDKDKIQGKTAMRKRSGLGMECIEDISGKGKELKDWEVIYGADQYKVISNFKDSLYDGMCELTGKDSKSNRPKLYPTREEIEKSKEKQAKLKIAMTVVDVASNLIPIGVNLKFAEEGVESGFKLLEKSVKKDILDGSEKAILSLIPTGSQVKDISTAVNKGGGKNWALSAVSTGGLLGKNIGGVKDKKLVGELEKELTEKEYKELREKEKSGTQEISLIRKFNMSNTDFKVLVLKKEQEIVIAYKGSKNSKKEILPDEMDVLQLLYSKIKFENKDSNIRFVGLNEGGDLSGLSGLLYGEKGAVFYSKDSNIKDYVEFTYDDIDKKYKNAGEITVETVKNISIGVAYELIGGVLLGTGVLPGLIALGIGAAIGVLFQFLKDSNYKRVYNGLKEIGYITEKGDVIGEVAENRLEIEDKDGNRIKVKESDFIYLLKETSGEILNEERVEINKKKDNSEAILDCNMKNYKLENIGEGYKIKSKNLILYNTLISSGGYSITPGVYSTNFSNEIIIIYNELLSKWEKEELNKKEKKEFEEFYNTISNVEKNYFVNLLQIIKNIQDNYKINKNLIEYIYKTKSNKLKKSSNYPEEVLKEYSFECKFATYLNEEGELVEEYSYDYIVNLLLSDFLSSKIKMSKSNYRGYDELEWKFDDNKIKKLKEEILKLDITLGELSNSEDLKSYLLKELNTFDKKEIGNRLDNIDISKYYKVKNIGFDKVEIQFKFSDRKDIFGKYTVGKLIGLDFSIKVSIAEGYNNYNQLKGSYEDKKESSGEISILSNTNNRKSFNEDKMTEYIKIDEFELGTDIKNQIEIEEYKRKDYGIDLLDKNIILGSIKKERNIDEKGYEFKIMPISTYDTPLLMVS